MRWAARGGVLDRSHRALLLPCILLGGVDVDSCGDGPVGSVVERACSGEGTRDWAIGSLDAALGSRDCASGDVAIPCEDVFCGELG